MLPYPERIFRKDEHDQLIYPPNVVYQDFDGNRIYVKLKSDYAVAVMDLAPFQEAINADESRTAEEKASAGPVAGYLLAVIKMSTPLHAPPPPSSAEGGTPSVPMQ
jgi:hypothetical protein